MKNKSTTSSHLLTILGIVALAVAIIALMTNNVNNDKKIEQLNETSEQGQAVMERQAVDSVHKERVKNVIAEYKKYSLERNLDPLLSLLADPMERYYLLSDVSRDEITKNIKRYWAKNPTEHTLTDMSDILIEILPDSSFYATLPSLYVKTKADTTRIISEYRLTADYKISHIRDYFAD
ncbi:hypothetical protein LJB87_02080 [Alistipes sp. OttesenSCG-928-L06]|nr:hypothetical protein [Alistipes sp. OttesenSCG-928-L06]